MRRGHTNRIERSGWLLFCAAMAGALGVLRFDGPRWAANVLVAAAFLVALALMWDSIRKGSRHL